MEKKSNNKQNAGFNRVDVFSLFNALYTTGQTKLSDHFINEEND